MGKAWLSKGGDRQWVPGEKAGGVPRHANGAGGQILGEAVKSLKDVLEAKRRWWGRIA